MTWTEDRIREFNSLQLDQKRSNLDYLLQSGGTTIDILCESALALDETPDLSVRMFGLLPIQLSTDESFYTIKTQVTGGSPVRLKFVSVDQVFSSNGSIKLIPSGSDYSKYENKICEASFVIGEIQMWGWRRHLFLRYLECIGLSGLVDRNIGKRRAHMDIPSSAVNGPIMSLAFENEVAERVKSEFIYSVNTFLQAYSMAQAEETIKSAYIYSYHAMIAPGRISFGGLPLPLYCALRTFIPSKGESQLDRGEFGSCLSSFNSRYDKTINQLLAMGRLAREGEPELAIIGAVAAIEFFLNRSYPDLVSIGRLGRQRSSSLLIALKKKEINSLFSVGILEQLDHLANVRNNLTHGEHRDRSNGNDSVVDMTYALEAVKLCLDVYRIVNTSVNSTLNEKTSVSNQSERA